MGPCLAGRPSSRSYRRGGGGGGVLRALLRFEGISLPMRVETWSFQDQYLSNRSNGVCFELYLKDGPLSSKLEIFLQKSSKKQL